MGKRCQKILIKAWNVYNQKFAFQIAFKAAVDEKKLVARSIEPKNPGMHVLIYTDNLYKKIEKYC